MFFFYLVYKEIKNQRRDYFCIMHKNKCKQTCISNVYAVCETGKIAYHCFDPNQI